MPERPQGAHPRTVAAAALLGIVGFAPPAAADRFVMEFEGEILGALDVGRATVDIDVNDQGYFAVVGLQSRGVARLFDQIRLAATAQGQFDNGFVRWRRYDLDHVYAQNRKRRVIVMRAADTGAVASDIRPEYRIWGSPPASDAQKRASRDPLSSFVAMAVHVRQTGGCNASFPTFDGRYHYNLEVSEPRRLRRYSVGDYRGPAIRCTLRYRPLAGYEADEQERNRIPRGEIWFATGIEAPFAPPIRMSAPLPVGRAVISAQRLQRLAVELGEPTIELPAP